MRREVRELYVIRKFQRGKKFFSLRRLGERCIQVYENSKWEPVKWENDMHCA